MRAIKHYWVFTNWQYKLFTLLLMPVTVVGMTFWGYFSENKLILAIAIGCYLFFLPLVDVMSDYWFLPGFYTKGNASLEFLQSTTKFKTMIKDVIMIDIIRRVVLYLGVFIIMKLVCTEPSVQGVLDRFSCMPMAVLLFTQLAVFASRFLKGWNQVYACAMFTLSATAFLMSGTIHQSVFIRQGIVVLFAVLAVAMIVLTVWFSLKKVRDSYYDK